MTLLEKAKTQPTNGYRRLIGPELLERIDLALAVINGEVMLEQAAKALGETHQNVRTKLGTALLTGATNGLIEIRRKA